jgi:oxygen-independent coproporphyrinogen-3 oxidase
MALPADVREAVVEVTREPFTVVCADGWRLRGDLVSGPSPRAVAIVSHAMLVDRRTLDRPRGRGLVSQLAARGVACVWADLRGHGNSGPRADEGGDWGYDDLVEGDVPALVGWARARFPSLPLACVGHSLFGHVALAHVARHPDVAVDGLALLACNAPNPDWTRRPLTYALKRSLLELAALMVRLRGRLPARRLGLGSDDEPAGYSRDFVRNTRAAAWRARDGFSYFDALPSVTRPLLAMAGAGDGFMAPAADVRGLVAAVPRLDFRVVGRCSGLAFDPDHMGIVLDERARPAWDQLADFILALPPPSR